MFSFKFNAWFCRKSLIPSTILIPPDNSITFIASRPDFGVLLMAHFGFPRNFFTPFFTTCDRSIPKNGSLFCVWVGNHKWKRRPSNENVRHPHIKYPIFFICLMRYMQYLCDVSIRIARMSFSKSIWPSSTTADLPEYSWFSGSKCPLLKLANQKRTVLSATAPFP